MPNMNNDVTKLLVPCFILCVYVTFLRFKCIFCELMKCFGYLKDSGPRMVFKSSEVFSVWSFVSKKKAKQARAFGPVFTRISSLERPAGEGFLARFLQMTLTRWLF